MLRAFSQPAALGHQRYDYLVSTPPSYSPESDKLWPLVLFLHGAGLGRGKGGAQACVMRGEVSLHGHSPPPPPTASQAWHGTAGNQTVAAGAGWCWHGARARAKGGGGCTPEHCGAHAAPRLISAQHE